MTLSTNQKFILGFIANFSWLKLVSHWYFGKRWKKWQKILFPCHFLYPKWTQVDSKKGGGALIRGWALNTQNTVNCSYFFISAKIYEYTMNNSMDKNDWKKITEKNLWFLSCVVYSFKILSSFWKISRNLCDFDFYGLCCANESNIFH